MGDLPASRQSQPPEQIAQLHADLIQTRAHVRKLVETQALAETQRERLLEQLTRFLSGWAELRQAKSELLGLTHTLDARVAERAAELALTVERLKAEVAQRARAEETLREQAQELSSLTAELTLAEQRERERLASVLHDDLQQMLVALGLTIRSIENAGDLAARAAASREARSLLEEALRCSRSLTQELAPPILKQRALIPALEWLCHWMQQRHSLSVQIASGDISLDVSDALRITLFQAVRELLFNVVKHAGTGTARLTVMRQGDEIEILVEDDGVGFDPAKAQGSGKDGHGFGLPSIRERLRLLGGRFEIASTPGHGSRILLRAPLRAAAEAGEEAASGH